MLSGILSTSLKKSCRYQWRKIALYTLNGIMLLSSCIINSQISCLKKLTELSYLTEQVTAFITSWNTMPIYHHDAKCSKLCFGNNTVIKEVMNNIITDACALVCKSGGLQRQCYLYAMSTNLFSVFNVISFGSFREK